MVRYAKLKPCPFCKATDAFVERADFSSAYVFCNECGAKGPSEYGEDDNEDVPGERAARLAWNKRARTKKAEAR